jgi:hypothetical protein
MPPDAARERYRGPTGSIAHSTHQGNWQMKTTEALFVGATVAASVLLYAACSARLGPRETTIDRDDIAGVVTGASGSHSHSHSPLSLSLSLSFEVANETKLGNVHALIGSSDIDSRGRVRRG